MNYGALIRSVVGNVPVKCFHVGLDDPTMLASLKSEISGADFFASDIEDSEILPWVNPVGDLLGDIGGDYDIFIVPVEAELFSTAIYIAIEGALKNGGLLVVYGTDGAMRSRSNLFGSMIREGTIAPFRGCDGNSKILMFQLEDGILVREM